MIPMVDLRAQYAEIRDEIERGLAAVMESCHFVLGPNLQAFEQEAAAYLGVGHAIGVASGTDALHLALLAAGIGPGDEVITSAFTFIASAEAICYTGAEPVFVDIDPKTFNIAVEAVENAIGPKTAAVLPAHLFGQPADVPALRALCEKYRLKLIEDCAQSFGAAVDGRQSGSFGEFGCFSFFPSKNLGCFGDGGLVVTDGDEAAERIRVLRNHGSRERYHHDVIGFNSRLDEIQAVILRAKLARLDTYNEKRRGLARLYSKLLAGLPVTTPFEDGSGTHVYHQYTLLSERRDALCKALADAGIASAIYYPIPLHRQKVFLERCRGVHLPAAESVAARCISLPIYPELGEDAVRLIVDVIRRVFDD